MAESSIIALGPHSSRLLIVGGVFGFLPIIGFWMAPLGALLLAQDVPFLRRPTLWALGWLEYKWDEWKRRRRQ